MSSAQLLSAAEVIDQTPSYIIDLDGIRETAVRMRNAWRAQFPDFVLAYSYKTNSVPAVTQLLRGLGCGAEVVSGSELELALDDGFSGGQIYFDGPHKTDDELDLALRHGARIQIDSLDEARRLVVRPLAKGARVSARVAGLRNGQEASRFGLTTSEFYEADRILARGGVAISGVHFNTGFHDEDATAFVAHIRHYGPLIQRYTDRRSKAEPFVIDIGGGFPSRSTLTRRHVLPHPAEFATAVGQAIDQLGLDRAAISLVIEPGRSLVEDHGVLVTTVVAVKHRADVRIAVVDAGTNLVRSITLWPHPTRFLRAGSAVTDVVGSMCFENDYFARGVSAPIDLKAGDRFMVDAAGGYDLPSANVWLRPHPAIYAVNGDSKPKIIRERGKAIRP